MTDAPNNQSEWVSPGSQSNEIDFIVRQILSECHTTVTVKVVKVYPNANPLLPGTVDVQPMVNLMDGAGVASSHGIVHGLIYVRYQAGASAFIMDPLVGDIGPALVCSRDISAVKATGKQSNPGSFRRFALPDGIFLGGILPTAAPTQYVRITPTSIDVVHPTAINLMAPMIALAGNVVSTGTLMNNGHAVGSTHQHVNSGGTGTGGIPV